MINRVIAVIAAGISLAALSACTGQTSAPRAVSAAKSTATATATATAQTPPMTQPWQGTPLPAAVVRPVRLFTVSAADPSDVLAAGAEHEAEIISPAVNGVDMGRLLILGWTGRAWSVQPVDVSFHGVVTAVAAGAHGTGWAIAEDTAGRYRPLRLSAGVWRDTAYPDSDEARLVLTDVAAAPDGTAWAVGGQYPADVVAGVQWAAKSTAPLILHWTGGAWRQVAPPADGWWLVQVTATPDGVWLAGQADTPSEDPADVLVVLAHLTAHGWQTATEPPLTGYLWEGVGALAVAADGSAWIQAGVSYARLAEGAPGGELLHWSSGHWTASLPWYGFTAFLVEKDIPVLVSAETRPAGAKLPPIVPTPNAEADNQVVVVPGTTQLWADAGNWIAYYP